MATKGVFITGASCKDLLLFFSVHFFFSRSPCFLPLVVVVIVAGIGLALAREFAKTGEYNLALVARRVDKLNEIKQELVTQYPSIKVEFRELDVTNYDRVAPVFNELAQAIGGIDIVIANSGVFTSGQVGTGEIAKSKQVIDVNFTGAVVTVDAAVEYFKKRGTGHVVGISSVVSFRGAPGLSVYAATKAALNLYLDVLDQELRQANITVTTIYPGLTESEMTKGLTSPHIISAEASAQQIVGHIKAKAIQAMVPLL